MEKVFFEQGSIKVTNSRFINGTTTYPIAGITSIVADVKEPSYSSAGWVAFVGIIFLIRGIVPPVSWGSIAFFVLLLVLAFGIVRTKKPKFLIVFGTAGGDKDGLVTEDKVARDTVLQALNDAVAHKD
jgi:hypothetical protein